jgi:fructosamine-3-kinase
MLTFHLVKHLKEKFSLNINSTIDLSSGDMNKVYFLEGQNKTHVVVINKAYLFLGMSKIEVSNLNALRET